MAHQWHHDSPELPRPRWMRFVRRFASEVQRDHVFMSAGAMAYFGFIGLFPTLIAAVSLVGLFADPEILQQQIARFADVMPAGGADLLRGQVQAIVAEHEQTLGIGLAVSLAIFLWGASNGASALIAALHLVYDETEDRSFLHARGAALLVAVASVMALTTTALALVVLPHVLAVVPGMGELRAHVEWLRWPLATLVIATFLAGMYRFAPSRPLPCWHTVTWGSLVATGLWLAASWGFSFYVEQAGRFQQIYGALGSVVALLLWLYLSGLAVLLGAEVDATVAWASRGYGVSERDRLDNAHAHPHPSA